MDGGLAGDDPQEREGGTRAADQAGADRSATLHAKPT